MATSADIIKNVMDYRAANPVNIPVADKVSSDDLNQNITSADVFAERDSMEANQLNQQSFQTALASVRANPENADPLAGLVFSPVTPAQQQQEQALTQQRGFLQKASDFFGSREKDSVGRLQDLQEDRGVPELESRIAESNERVAQLRGELMKARPQVETEAGQTRVGAEARLNPLERNLRAEIASEALVQSALTGNLQAVNSNIDRILELEFQDEAFEIQNLQAQIDSAAAIAQTYEPAAQREAQQQIQAFQMVANERAQALQTAAADKQQTLQLSVQAAQNGAPSNIVAQANQLPSDQAAALLAPYLKDPMLGLQQQGLSLDNQLKQAELADIQARKDAIASGAYVLSEDQQSAAFKLIDDYEAVISEMDKQDQAHTRIKQAAEDPSAAGDLALIFNYMKLLDPGSVVRESEFATAAGARGWLNTPEGSKAPAIVKQAIQRAYTGERLLPEQREDFVNRSELLYEGVLKDKEQRDGVFIKRAEKFGVPSEVVVRDFRDKSPELETSVEGAGLSDQAAQLLLNNLVNLSAGSTRQY